ncbi:MAG: hypothetical protein HKO62_09495, partial [Gammaproteobacteria bacterium]|nr:hypothetical protein [Gammaproteobacteria bacterium]
MLKWLAIVLLIVNVAMFGWLYDQHVKATLRHAGGASPIAPGTPELVLVDELDRLPGSRDADDSAYGGGVSDGGLTEEEANFEFDDDGVVPESAPPAEEAAIREVIPGTASSLSAGRCYRAGPYLTRDAYEELLEWLRERTVSVAVTTDRERTRQLYWVYLEALDAESAAASIEDFKQQG